MVLDGVNSSLASPIDGCWVSDGLLLFDDVVSSVSSESVSSELDDELSFSHVGELVESSGEGEFVLSVVLLDLEVVQVEDSESEKLLLWGFVSLSVVLAPFLEHFDDLGWAMRFGLGGELVD